MSNSYFGLVGKGQIIWYFDNNLILKDKIIKSRIIRARFGHMPISFVPYWMIKLYDNHLKNKKEHTASHAFVVLDVICDDIIISIYIDYNGSVHIREDLCINDKRIYYLDRDVDNVPFQILLDNLYKGFPEYNHRIHNCKHFMERICDILFQNLFTLTYLKLLHNNKTIFNNFIL